MTVNVSADGRVLGGVPNHEEDHWTSGDRPYGRNHLQEGQLLSDISLFLYMKV